MAKTKRTPAQIAATKRMLAARAASMGGPCAAKKPTTKAKPQAKKKKPATAKPVPAKPKAKKKAKKRSAIGSPDRVASNITQASPGGSALFI